jgi:hypothetical protein
MRQLKDSYPETDKYTDASVCNRVRESAVTIRIYRMIQIGCTPSLKAPQSLGVN